MLTKLFSALFITALAGALAATPPNSSKASGEDLFLLAQLYETGNDSIPADLDRSISYYRMAAREGYAPARNYLGFLHYEGSKTSKDVDSALYWIGLAAEEGDIKAAGNLGYLLSQASDVSHDYPRAFKWLQKASDAGLKSSLVPLAELYRRGLGVEADTLKAIALYDRAIESGIQDAQLYLLAMMGNSWKSLPADSALALGLKYYVHRAPVAGIDLIETAANAGSPKALALLGDAYSRGIGVPYDHDLSVEFFHKAAILGDPSAQFILAELLEFFPDLPGEDLHDPSYWYEKAAQAGVDDAEEAYKLLFTP